ncbi:monooxygenase [Ruegeria faecimaris]|uniref:monooxygenase n=1 Tax=Ruegeria faecimaris TaxID=686389 RepID=UPI00232EBC0A|nr:monooxygenase [Ruegeria faecimaris]
MSTLKVWDLHMTYEGPITEEFLAGTEQLAKSIAEEPGIIWKIWTVEDGTNHYGSTYLFRNREYLESYKIMHLKRLEAIGITVTADHVFDIMEEVSRVNRAPLEG